MTDPLLPPPELVDLLRELQPEDRARLQPPPEVWAGIAAATGMSGHDSGAQADAPVSLDRVRRARAARLPWVLSIAAAVLVLALGAALVLSSGDEGSVVASVTITSEGLQIQAPAPAEARLVDVDGHYELELDLPSLPAASGYYEAWIIDTNVQGMFSLGVVEGSGRFLLPDGVDPADYPVVDISVEPIDGNPTHSGQSIWRGVLTL